MSKLESLVPPQELCKLIPAGEFEDSCFVRIGEDTIILRSNVRVVSGRQDDIYPAPTLQEIITAIGQYEIFGFGERFSIMQGDVCVLKQKSKTTAALKLWLQLKEIEV